ncbi:MAG: hypothetical protein JXJ22_04300 [Bacteroidales bacterium]|nr:hypothetical protein [Bacteroidales bacterium]
MRKDSAAVFLLIAFIFLSSCEKIREYNQKPELGSLQQGLKTSVAIGYCSSVAMSAFKGDPLPDNVTTVTRHSDIYSSSWLLYINFNSGNPLPFNSNIGDIIVAGIGDAEGGVISVLFGDFDLLNHNLRLYGIQTVPVIEQEDYATGEKSILTLFVKEDIIIGNVSSDVFLNLDLSEMQFSTEMNRYSTPIPSDAYVAVKQNVWFVKVDQDETSDNMYDDMYTIHGGGQIAETDGISGGIIYHAMINTKVNYSMCTKNPISGVGFSQNFKAGGDILIDLGNTLLSFHSNCDGKAHVDFSSGKYIGYNGKDIALDLE